MGAAVDSAALAACIRATLETFLPDHPGMEETDLIVAAGADRCDGAHTMRLEVAGHVYRLHLEPPPAPSGEALLSADLLAELRVTPLSTGEIIQRLGLLDDQAVRRSVARELHAEGFVKKQMRALYQKSAKICWVPRPPTRTAFEVRS